MGGTTPLNHHHIPPPLATINITLLTLQSVPRFLPLHADVSFVPLSELDSSNPLLCPPASEKSTRGISLVDRKCLPTRMPSDLQFRTIVFI